MVITVAAAAPPAPAATLAVVMTVLAVFRLALLPLRGALFDGTLVVILLDDDLVFFLFDRRRRQELLLLETGRLLCNGAAQDRIVLRADRFVDLDGDVQAEPRLELGKRVALVIEHIEC